MSSILVPEKGSVDARIMSPERIPGKLIEGIDIDWFMYADNYEELYGKQQ